MTPIAILDVLERRSAELFPALLTIVLQLPLPLPLLPLLLQEPLLPLEDVGVEPGFVATLAGAAVTSVELENRSSAATEQKEMLIRTEMECSGGGL